MQEENPTSAGEVVSRIVPFKAGDGLDCNLIHVQGEKAATRGPVLLVHGAGVRANIFRAPVENSLVDVLVERGYDVWLENWRASIDLPANLWTLDQAAVHDHPKAVEKIVEETGADRVKAVIHCQGSTSFMMSAMAGLIPQVDVIVSNAVSLHTVVPKWSRFKLRSLVPALGLITKYLNPRWGIEAPTLRAKLISLAVRLTHHECDNAVCKQVSFTYGSGFPALWSHDTISDATHEWIKGEFAAVPLKFFAQMNRCVKKGNLVAVEDYPELPRDFAAQPPKTDARFAFFAGANNLCFLSDGQVRTYDFFNSLRKDYHSLNVLPGYGHLDVFMGENSARDIFPLMINELERGG